VLKSVENETLSV